MLHDGGKTQFLFVHDSKGAFDASTEAPIAIPKLTLIHDDKYRENTTTGSEIVVCYAPNKVAQKRVEELSKPGSDYYPNNVHTSIVAVKKGAEWILYESTIIEMKHKTETLAEKKYLGVPEETGCLAVVPLAPEKAAYPVSRDYVPSSSVSSSSSSVSSIVVPTPRWSSDDEEGQRSIKSTDSGYEADDESDDKMGMQT